MTAAVDELASIPLLRPTLLEGERKVDTLGATDCTVNVMPRLAGSACFAKIEAVGIRVTFVLALERPEKWMLKRRMNEQWLF